MACMGMRPRDLDAVQCRCGPPPQQRPHDFGVPVHSPPPADAAEAVAPPPDEANTESFFSRRVEPQCGQRVPFQSLERTSTSLSVSHAAQ